MSTALVLLMIPGVGYVVHTKTNRSGKPEADSRFQFLLLGSCSQKVGPFVDMAFDDGSRRHLVPMVLLGLLSHLLTFSGEVHW